MAEPIRMGDTATIDHVFRQADVERFAAISGDDNPIHRDPDAARLAGFDREVVHGMLVGSLISRVLGTVLPGPGTILLGQELRYRAAVHAGERLQATVEVISVREDKPVIVLRTVIRTDRIVIEGEATVLLRPIAADQPEPAASSRADDQ